MAGCDSEAGGGDDEAIGGGWILALGYAIVGHFVPKIIRPII